MYLAHCWGDPVWIQQDLWHQKTRFPRLSYSIVSVMHFGRTATCDGLTDGWKQGHSVYRASIEPHGKKLMGSQRSLLPGTIVSTPWAWEDVSPRYFTWSYILWEILSIFNLLYRQDIQEWHFLCLTVPQKHSTFGIPQTICESLQGMSPNVVDMLTTLHGTKV